MYVKCCNELQNENCHTLRRAEKNIGSKTLSINNLTLNFVTRKSHEISAYKFTIENEMTRRECDESYSQRSECEHKRQWVNNQRKKMSNVKCIFSEVLIMLRPFSADITFWMWVRKVIWHVFKIKFGIRLCKNVALPSLSYHFKSLYTWIASKIVERITVFVRPRQFFGYPVMEQLK